MFWLDEALCSSIFLDGVITLVDAKYALQVAFSSMLAHEAHLTIPLFTSWIIPKSISMRRNRKEPSMRQ
jgi:G3E family GTPase